MLQEQILSKLQVEYRRLNLPDEDKFLNRGLFYGAGVSEASMCEDQHVYVVGGGNSAGQAAMYFSQYARQVTMLVRSGNLADSLSEYLIKKISSNDTIEVLFNSEVTALIGETALQQIEITHNQDNSVHHVDTQRLFVCIGGAPNTDWAKDTHIIRDRAGYLITGPDLLQKGQPPETWPLDREPFYLETSVPGSFAAGDVRHGSVKRVASAVGEGAMAVTFVHQYLKETE